MQGWPAAAIYLNLSVLLRSTCLGPLVAPQKCKSLHWRDEVPDSELREFEKTKTKVR